jgi:hypothetical protein
MQITFTYTGWSYMYCIYYINTLDTVKCYAKSLRTFYLNFGRICVYAFALSLSLYQYIICIFVRIAQTFRMIYQKANENTGSIVGRQIVYTTYTRAHTHAHRHKHSKNSLSPIHGTRTHTPSYYVILMYNNNAKIFS